MFHPVLANKVRIYGVFLDRFASTLAPGSLSPTHQTPDASSRLPVTGNKPKLQLDTVGRIVPILLLSAFERGSGIRATQRLASGESCLVHPAEGKLAEACWR
jgi:hypothetical protein